MDAAKRKKLEAAGWRIGSAADFLALSEEEAAYVEVHLARDDTSSDQARRISKRRREEAS